MGNKQPGLFSSRLICTYLRSTSLAVLNFGYTEKPREPCLTMLTHFKGNFSSGKAKGDFSSP